MNTILRKYNRLSYYGINGVPTGVIDGVIPTTSAYPGAVGLFTTMMMQDAADVPASFDIDVSYTVSNLEVVVDVEVLCTQAASGNLKLRIAVLEKYIEFDEAPGSNGESEFHNIMKKFLPGTNGVSMASSYDVGDTFSATESWTHSNVYNLEELAVVVWIQNDTNKEVLQGAFAETGEFVAESEFDAAGISINNVDSEDCASSITPTFTLRNFGSENLTSCDIEYTIGGESNTINWTGDLAFFESEEVALGEIATPTESDETLSVTVSNPNGEEDGFPGNDVVETTITAVPSAGTELEVTIVTDNYGNETYWRVVDGDGAVIAEGGNSWVGTTNTGEGQGSPQIGSGTYSNNTTYTEEVTVPAGVDCYSFEIYDYWGDGICCQYGSGSYEVTDVNSGQTLAEGGQFGADDAKFFSAGVLGVEETSEVTGFKMFPNPTNGTLNVEFNLLSSQRVTIDVLDVTGRLVLSKDLGMLPAGYSLQQVNLYGQSQGLYLLNMNVNEGRVIGKFTVNN